MYIQVYQAQDPIRLSELAQGHKHNVKTHNATVFLICLPCGVKTEKGTYKKKEEHRLEKRLLWDDGLWQLVHLSTLESLTMPTTLRFYHSSAVNQHL